MYKMTANLSKWDHYIFNETLGSMYLESHETLVDASKSARFSIINSQKVLDKPIKIMNSIPQPEIAITDMNGNILYEIPEENTPLILVFLSTYDRTTEYVIRNL